MPMDFSGRSMVYFVQICGSIPLIVGLVLALIAYVTSLISGQNVISDNEREFVSLSYNTFEV